jgi:hypothetical protein
MRPALHPVLIGRGLIAKTVFMVLESQEHHKIVNLMFTITHQDIKLSLL